MIDPEEFNLLPQGGRRDLSFSGDFKEAIFGTSLMKMPTLGRLFYPDGSLQLPMDPHNTYNLNNYGYRGPDFSSSNQILMAGCSLTYGVGVPESGTWPSQLATRLGLSYSNLSMPGASVEWVIDSVFRYIETFGAPERGIVLLLPDPFRSNVVISKHVNSAESLNDSDLFPKYADSTGDTSLISYYPTYEAIPRLIKRPYPIEYTYVLEESVYRTVSKIRDLERYCEAANINLTWGSWSDYLIDIASQVSETYPFKYYAVLNEALGGWKEHYHALIPNEQDPEGILNNKLHHIDGREDRFGCTDSRYCICFSECHFELLEVEEFRDAFHLGTDRHRASESSAHYGVHKHIHIAELLAEIITEDWRL